MLRRLNRNRPIIMATAYLVAVIALAVGAFFGAKALNAIDAQAKRGDACALIKDTEALYAKQRAKAASPAPQIAFLGDSYSEGLYITTPLDAFPYLVSKQRGLAVAVNGVGGSGYVAGGPCDGQKLLTRLAEVLQAKPKVLVVQAGINDRGKDGVREAALLLFEKAGRISPETKVVVLGPFAPDGARGPELDSVSESVSAAAATAGVEFIDPRDWNFPVLQDGLHPTETGHKIIAERLAGALPLTI